MRENDAISRSAVLENIYEMDISDCTDVEDIIDKAYAMIADAPAIDVAPVVHARWKYKVAYAVNARVTNIIYCTACGKGFHRIEGVNFNFCPNCGARMDGEADV